MNSSLKMQLLFSLIFLLFVSNVVRPQVFYTSFDPEESINQWLNASPALDSTAFKGHYINHIKATQTYGHGLEYLLPDSLFNTNLHIHFRGWFRFDSTVKNATYVISLLRNDSLIYWHGIKLMDQIHTIGKWQQVVSNINVPFNYNPNSLLKTYIWNPSSEVFDMDAVELSIEKLEIPTFMPAPEPVEAVGQAEVLTQNHYYELLYFPASNSIVVADSRGRHITRPLGWLTEISDAEGEVVESYKWKVVRNRSKDNDAAITLHSRTKQGTIKLIITANFFSPRLQFSVEEKLRKQTSWHRRAMVFGYHGNESHVMRKNSLLDNQHLQEEYYLDREGVVIGNDNSSLAMYHMTGISSAQLNTKKKNLILNLDYAYDHPLLHYPLAPDTTGMYIDLSSFTNRPRQKFRHHFNLYAGIKAEAPARFMPVPHGYEAAIIFTEHADWADVRTHRAVNFGHEDVIYPADATGGFVKYKIPVTKSVFFNNPDSITNDEASQGLFTGLHATIQTDTAFYELLKQLHELGHDICLHTPEQYTSTQENLKQAMKYMQREFGSPTWIDHGYNNLPHNNRENLVCDGLNPPSPQYARELWNNYGIHYFWNPYLEEVNPFIEWGFNGHLQLPYPGYGDLFPNRMICRHPNFSEALMWSTTGTLEVHHERFWGYLFHPERLQELIRNRAIYINHVYPAWVSESKGFWRFDEHGKAMAQPGFNDALSRIAKLREEHKLLPTTIAELLAYYESLQLLDYQILDAGRILITHNGHNKIEGLGMAVVADHIEINGIMPDTKRSGQDIIFWFDIEPGESVQIRYW